MKAINNLFRVKNDIAKEPKIPAIEEKNSKYEGTDSLEQGKLNAIYSHGYKDSLGANGDPVNLEINLENRYEQFKEECRRNKQEQENLKKPFVEKHQQLISTKRTREALKSVKEEDLEKTEKRIEKIKDDIIAAKNDPGAFGIDATKKPKAQFVIGIIILLPITLYLLVFYLSASFSAFFKDFESTEVISAIFDANAFEKALNEGWMEAVFVSTIPFAFMGLGYLIHMFQKEGKSGIVKIVSLFIVTFIFDTILAYQIERKIYDIEKTLNSPEFNFSIAFQSVNFWGIIFAGFVVYVIWGLVFDFIMKEFEDMDKIKAFEREAKKKQSHLIERAEKIRHAISELDHEIANLKGQIESAKMKIDGFVFSNRKYLLIFTQYLKGWYMAISSEIVLSRDKQESLLQKCDEVKKAHILKHEITNEDFENVIYR